MNGALTCAYCETDSLDNAELVAHLASEHDLAVSGRDARVNHTRNTVDPIR